ncbi:MAG: hypothetical protein ABS81_10280 [Pseudonocardia sp. SCN 72-86]|nr:MAG: hypothetical protein ABS81_10280 [Pseudonocardia sp. SCN 72-86]
MLAEGLAFPECPRVVDGEVWFVDTPHVKVLGRDGKVREHATLPARLVLGLAVLPDGAVLANDVLGRRVFRVDAAGREECRIDLSGHFDHPINEVVAAEDGSLYVGSMGFDMLAHAAPRPSRLARIAPDGTVTATGPDVSFPNGMLVEADTLYVAESTAHRITALQLGPDGVIGSRIAVDLNGRADDHPDGIARDADGTFWYADPLHGHVAGVTGGGEQVAVLEVGLPHPTACAAAGDRLYVTATAALANAELVFSGAGVLVELTR